MEQFLSLPSNRNAWMAGKHSITLPRTSVGIMIAVPGMCTTYAVYCEIDSDGQSVYRDEPDPDDMTDYGYRHRNQPRQAWTPPGYGDDD